MIPCPHFGQILRLGFSCEASGDFVALQHIHAYLVHPKKGEEDTSQPTGTDVPLSGPMFNLMYAIYSKSESDCDIDITFRSTPDGKQQNDCRDLLLTYLAAPSLGKGQTIAERLGETTDFDRLSVYCF